MDAITRKLQGGKLGNMIQIDDFDLPIQAAAKIINGTKEISLSPMMKSLRKAVCGESVDDKEKSVVDMFELEEIKEIADYLMIYYQAHINGD